MGKIKQIFCRHEWEYQGIEQMYVERKIGIKRSKNIREDGPKYFSHKCSKCGKIHFIDVWEIKYDIENEKVWKVKTNEKMDLILPEFVCIGYGGDVCYSGISVYNVVRKYAKMGFDITAYGKEKYKED